MVKPVAAGSSHGVTLVSDAGALAPALDAAFALDDRVLVEDVVDGREIDVAVLGRPDGARVVAPALEIVVDGLFDYGDEVRRPRRLPGPGRPLRGRRARQLEDAALAMYDALGCAGVARIDFFLTDDGPVLNEVNTDARASPSTRRCRRCSPPPGSTTPTCSTSWSATALTPREPDASTGLDLLRGVAIALVMLRHAFPAPFAGAGVVGVVMFFALSAAT